MMKTMELWPIFKKKIMGDDKTVCTKEKLFAVKNLAYSGVQTLAIS